MSQIATIDGKPFEIEPGGSLFHIESIPDELNTTLMNVEAISATVINGEVHVIVS